MTQTDRVLTNGVFYTMDTEHPTAEALALRGSHIVAAGRTEDMLSLLDADGSRIDLQGRAVIPGLIDTHLHFASYGDRLNSVNVQEVPTLEGALERVSERVATSAPGAWIEGGGWNCNLWGDGSFPHRRDLDRIAPHNPVLLSSKDGHSAWVNTQALALAGITGGTPDPGGGHIRKDAQGQPTGILQENAIGLVRSVLPPRDQEDVTAACKRAVQNAHQVGLTGIHDCEGEQALAAFQELRRHGELTLRVLMHVPAPNLDAAIAVGIRDGLGDEWIRIAGVKIFCDGALGSRSAWMLSPYDTDPTNCGIPTTTPEDLDLTVGKAHRAGLSTVIHAIGDAANRIVLDAIEKNRSRQTTHLRNRIEHVQLLHPDDIVRLARLGVIASMQPIHATSDIDIADLHWGVRSATAYAWRSLLDAGAVLSFGSDAPVEDISPLRGIHAAVTRRRPDGYPGERGWYPKQRLTVSEAVYAYTMGAAYASGEEALKGTLTSGKLADLVVLDRDIFRIDPMDIVNTQVVGTMVAGSWVYRNDNL